MLSFLTQTLAVPYGYTNDTVNMDNYSLECFVINNNTRNMSSVTSDPVLPDLIMDTTAPPPSPLRRAHSYHFLFPEKTNINTSWDVCTDKSENVDSWPSQEESKEQKKFRTIGADLKAIADKFHLDHSKVLGKQSNDKVDVLELELAIPVVATRCLQAGLITLLCWRLLNKLR